MRRAEHGLEAARGATLAVAAVTAFAGAVLGWSAGRAGPSMALLPAPRPSVAPVHHLHRPGAPECAACHPRAAESRWASDLLAPTMERCASCHADARDAGPGAPVTDRCRACHLGLPEGARPVRGDHPRPNVRFPHRSHWAVGCAACHPAASRAAPAGAVRDVPTMEVCHGCHEREDRASTECRTCHLVHGDGRMVTEIRGERLLPPAWLEGETHGEGWVGDHARRAGADSKRCAACHRETFCQGCHTGRLRPRNVHPGDWMSSHGVSTRMDSPRCRGCHRGQSFCITCHRRAGVAPDSPVAAGRGVGGRYHGDLPVERLCKRARYDIAACASCHSEGSCISCHAAIDPHPAGWRRRCKPLAQRNHRACAKCHEGEIWRRCE